MKAVLQFFILIFAIVVFIVCLASLLINTNVFANTNNVTIGILKDIAQTVTGTNKLDPTDYLELEKVFELKQNIAKSELTSVLFTIFSVVIITVGVFFVNMINRTYDKIDERIIDIKKTLSASESSTNATKTAVDKVVKSVDEVSKQMNENEKNHQINQATSSIQRLQFTLMSLKLKSIGDYDPRFDLSDLLPRIRDQLSLIEQSCEDISRTPYLPTLYDVQSIITELSYCQFAISGFEIIMLTKSETLSDRLNKLVQKFRALRTSNAMLSAV